MSSPEASVSGGGPDDFELMRRIRAGDGDAFAALVRRHQQPLLNFFARMGADRDAEDMVQETFIRVFGYRERYRPTAKFTTFLYTVARHVWVDAVRRDSRRQRFEEALEAESAAVHDGGLGTAQAHMDVQAALARLPERLRSVVILSVHQGLRYREIADVLGIPPGTVKSRMFLALRRLKEMLDEG
jgi:RNA polymerase sigma-70 factor (ECF subfamily)